MPKSTKEVEEKKKTKKVKKEEKVVTETPKKVAKSSKTKSATAKKVKETTKKTSTKPKKTTKTKEVVTNLEYYDLPYRYNQTVIKILSQTPNTLFIYWDISDKDRKNFEDTYGDNFFSMTKPVLIIHNETKNYSFEIDINDFANSWYLNLADTDCKYSIELGRRFIDTSKTEASNNNYVYISSSNNLITPNDHVLYNFNNEVQFKNIKNNSYFYKKFKDLSFIQNVFSKEMLEGLNNPSSNFI